MARDGNLIRLSSRLRIPAKKIQVRRPPSARPRTGRKSGAVPRNDRQIRAPAAVGRVVSSGRSGDRVPTMGARGRSMRLSHVERFATVSPSSSAFAVTSYSLNPGLSVIFPWLSDVANRFEKYKFSSISFRYVPQSAALAGLVTMAFDFDPNDQAPETMAEATTYHDYISTSIWHDAVLALDLASGDKLPQKNTRPGLPGGDIDLNVYDVGRLHILTEGCAAGVVGYVEVAYTIDLMVHQVQAGVGGMGSATAGLDATHTVGTDFVSDPQAFLPVSVVDSNTLKFEQPFEGLLDIRMEGTGISGTYAVTSTASVTSVAAATSTRIVGTLNVRARLGDTISVVPGGATTLTSVQWRFGRARYTALG